MATVLLSSAGNTLDVFCLSPGSDTLQCLLDQSTSPVLLTSIGPHRALAHSFCLGITICASPREGFHSLSHATSRFENRSRRIDLPRISHHCLTRHGLFYSGPSYPEGNFRRNQLLGSSMSLSPLCFTPTSNLHVSTEANLHHSFP